MNHVESPDEIAARIDRAAKIAGAGRIGWVHPDCGFWMLKRSIADRKIEALVRGRDSVLRTEVNFARSNPELEPPSDAVRRGALPFF